VGGAGKRLGPEAGQRPDDKSLQTAADKLLEWTQSNRMLMNANKTKEMVIYYGNKVKSENIKPIIISDKEIERV
jgi:hypothetical protein